MNFGRIGMGMLLAACLGWLALYVDRFHNPKPVFPVHGEFVAIEGQRIYFDQAGEGRNLVCLSGFPMHSGAYQELAAKAGKTFRVLALDFPGLGLSDKQLPPLATPADLALSVKLLLDKLGIDDADIVGHDMGGGVGMILAATYPRLVRHLILLAPDSSLGCACADLGWWWRLPVAGEAWASLALDRGFIRRYLKHGWAPGMTDWDNFVERYARTLDTTLGRQGFLSLARGCAAFSYSSYEEHVRVPTLILWGQRDPMVSPETGRKLADRLAGAQFQILPGVGHFPLEEAPEQVWPAMQKFLTATSTTPRVPEPYLPPQPEASPSQLPAEPGPPAADQP